MVTVLLNPAAGAAALKADIADLFRAARSDALIVELRQGQDPAEAARTAAARASIVVAAGGDGTVSRVASGLIGTAAVLGVLPLGTFNHFAKDLRIPLNLEQAVATIAAGRVESVDVGMVNDRVFLNNSSIGIYPGIIEARVRCVTRCGQQPLRLGAVRHELICGVRSLYPYSFSPY